MQADGNAIAYIDEFYCEGLILVFTGWVVCPERISFVELVLGINLKLPLQSFGLCSKDVEQVYGGRAANARFSERLKLPEDVMAGDFCQASLNMKGLSGQYYVYSITPLRKGILPHQQPRLHRLKFQDLRLGIGVTTFNRKSTVTYTLKKIAENSRREHVLVVADDGSSDGTTQVLKSQQVKVIGGLNRGVAWNKNRALFYLSEIEKCDIVILIEDDTYPDRAGWESSWMLAALMYGHCNFLPSWFPNPTGGGFGQWYDPAIFKGKVSGQCSVFSSDAVSWVGYLDTRFGKYGFEHAEHSMRMVRSEFGGFIQDDDADRYNYYLMSGSLAVLDVKSSGNEELIKSNALVLQQIQNDGIYRSAWRSDEERRSLRMELLGS